MAHAFIEYQISNKGINHGNDLFREKCFVSFYNFVWVNSSFLHDSDYSLILLYKSCHVTADELYSQNIHNFFLLVL